MFLIAGSSLQGLLADIQIKKIYLNLLIKILEIMRLKASLKKFYRELDPTNVFNPGIGGTSKNKKWA